MASLALLLSCAGQPDPAPRGPRPLRVIIGADIASPDPQLPFDAGSWAVLGNIFEALVGFDQALRVEPEVATRWVNPSPGVWRFHLDPAARFSDGSSVTAADVEFSIERLRGLPDSELLQFARHIESVEVIDELTVDVHTVGPRAILNSLAFIPILSERQMAAVTEVTELPIGSGPYRVAAWHEGRSLSLTVNEHDANPPVIRDASLEIYLGEEQLQKILETKPDLALLLGQTSFEGLTERKVPGQRLVPSAGLSVFYVTLNVRPTLPDGRANPLSDKRVRQALSLATDRQEIVDRVLLGRGRVVSQLVIPHVFGFEPKIAPPEYDASAARTLLQEAGHEQLELTFLEADGNSERVPDILIEQWARIGVRASREVRLPDEHQSLLETGNFQLTVEGWACSSADASEILDFLLRGRDESRGVGLTNNTGFSHPEMNEIADRNLAILDTQERLVALQRAMRIAAQEGPYLPLFAQDDNYVISDTVQWAPRVDGELRLSEARFRSARESGEPR